MTDNNQLSALVVRHIGDLEAALRQAKTIEERLAKEAADCIEATLDKATWFANLEIEQYFWFSHRSWLREDTKSQKAYAWMELLEQLQEGSDGSSTWLAMFLAAGPGSDRLAFFFKQELLSPSRWRKLLRGSGDTITALGDGGFTCDVGKGTLYMPVTLDRETLSRAFEEEDFTDAFAPFAKALDAVQAALPLLDRLIAAARKTAAET